MLQHAQQGDPYEIDTHDVDPGDVLSPDTGLLADAFDDAYVTVVFDTGNDTGNCDFVRNLTNPASQGATYRATTFEAADYWSAYIQAAYEYIQARDNDPDDEAGVDGYNKPNEPEYAFLFKEARRDLCDDEHPEWNGTLVEQRTVVHEIGHQFELAHHAACVMAGNTDPSVRTSSFCASCIAGIRGLAYP